MTAKDITPDDPFGYKADRLRIEAEDREAEELLAGMVASEPEQFIRGLLSPGNRNAEAEHSTVTEYGDGDMYVRKLLAGLTGSTPPDGPYDPSELTPVEDEENGEQ